MVFFEVLSLATCAGVIGTNLLLEGLVLRVLMKVCQVVEMERVDTFYPLPLFLFGQWVCLEKNGDGGGEKKKDNNNKPKKKRPYYVGKKHKQRRVPPRINCYRCWRSPAFSLSSSHVWNDSQLIESLPPPPPPVQVTT